MLHEFWREYSVREINNTKKRKCINCPYSKRFGSSGNEYKDMGKVEMGVNKRGTKVNIGNIYCDYFTMNGRKRGCRPENCEFYKEGVNNDRSNDSLL